MESDHDSGLRRGPSPCTVSNQTAAHGHFWRMVHAVSRPTQARAAAVARLSRATSAPRHVCRDREGTGTGEHEEHQNTGIADCLHTSPTNHM